jgi:POT family proton-dependent oligopeptide transporter
MHFMWWELSSAAVNNSINGAMIVALTFLFSWMWIALSRHNLNPNSAVKFGLGLLQLGLGFYMFVHGASYAGPDGKVSLFWFVLGYFFMTTGELCLSPIGLSAITKLSPPKMVGLMMGMWFLASAFGQYLAGLIGSLMAIPEAGEGGAKLSPVDSLGIYSGVFMKIAAIAAASGLVLLAISPVLRKWMKDVR